MLSPTLHDLRLLNSYETFDQILDKIVKDENKVEEKKDDNEGGEITKILITGVTGQDGSNMVDYLLSLKKNEKKIYKIFGTIKVYGTIRRLSVKNHKNIEHLCENPNFELLEMDLTDACSINNVFTRIKPDYCINFAAQSFVGSSWNYPLQTMDVNCMGVMRLLEAIRTICPNCRFYSAGSSEEFGDVVYSPQDIHHPLRPRSPYGASKCAARHIVKVYRESYNLFAVHATLFNHEGKRRGEEFVTRKITKYFANLYKQISTIFKEAEIKKNEDEDENKATMRDEDIYDEESTREFRTMPYILPNYNDEFIKEKCLQLKPLEVGNIYAQRDWSDSEDFMVAIWKMLIMEKPDEYLLSSNVTHSVKEFIMNCVDYVFYNKLKLNSFLLFWKGKEKDEKLILRIKNRKWETICEIPIVVVNEKYYRPAEVQILLGDSTDTRKKLDWEPQTTFNELVEKMINVDID